MNYSLREASLIINKPYKLLYDQMKRGELPKPTIKKGKRKLYSEDGLTELIIKVNPGRVIRTFCGDSAGSFAAAALAAEMKLNDFLEQVGKAFPKLSDEIRMEPMRCVGFPRAAGYAVNITVAFDL